VQKHKLFERKGKERKGKEEYLYSAFSHEGTYKALRHGSHSFTCKQHHACLSFVAFTRCHHHSNWGSRHPTAAHYSFIDPERMKGWVGLSWGGMVRRLLTAYFIRDISAKKYQNPFMCVKVIRSQRWDVFFETRCSYKLFNLFWIEVI